MSTTVGLSAPFVNQAKAKFEQLWSEAKLEDLLAALNKSDLSLELKGKINSFLLEMLKSNIDLTEIFQIYIAKKITTVVKEKAMEKYQTVLADLNSISTLPDILKIFKHAKCSTNPTVLQLNKICEPIGEKLTSNYAFLEKIYKGNNPDQYKPFWRYLNRKSHTKPNYISATLPFLRPGQIISIFKNSLMNVKEEIKSYIQETSPISHIRTFHQDDILKPQINEIAQENYDFALKIIRNEIITADEIGKLSNYWLTKFSEGIAAAEDRNDEDAEKDNRDKVKKLFGYFKSIEKKLLTDICTDNMENASRKFFENRSRTKPDNFSLFYESGCLLIKDLPSLFTRELTKSSVRKAIINLEDSDQQIKTELYKIKPPYIEFYFNNITRIELLSSNIDSIHAVLKCYLSARFKLPGDPCSNINDINRVFDIETDTFRRLTIKQTQYILLALKDIFLEDILASFKEQLGADRPIDLLKIHTYPFSDDNSIFNTRSKTVSPVMDLVLKDNFNTDINRKIFDLVAGLGLITAKVTKPDPVTNKLTAINEHDFHLAKLQAHNGTDISTAITTLYLHNTYPDSVTIRFELPKALFTDTTNGNPGLGGKFKIGVECDELPLNFCRDFKDQSKESIYKKVEDSYKKYGDVAYDFLNTLFGITETSSGRDLRNIYNVFMGINLGYLILSGEDNNHHLIDFYSKTWIEKFSNDQPMFKPKLNRNFFREHYDKFDSEEDIIARQHYKLINPAKNPLPLKHEIPNRNQQQQH